MNSLDYIPASDGAANASLMTVTSVRAALATTIQVNTVANVPAKFYGSYGEPHTFTDPVTSETITIISEATAVDFAGHVDGSNIEIDEIAPGYTDNGNEVGDIVILRPVTEWSNNLHNVIKNRAINPVGSVVDFAGSTAPLGWLLCYGQALDAATNVEYQELYDVIGNTYGGTNNTDFVVPDARGRVIAGQDDMGGVSADRLTGTSGGVDGDILGAAGGAETHTLTTAQLANHTHGTGGSHTANRVTSTAPGSANNAGVVNNQDNFSGSAGGGDPHNNVQPTLILNKIIKY